MKEAVKLGYKAICLTVDAIVTGNRERDIRAPWVLDDTEKPDSAYQVEEDDTVREPRDTEMEEKEINILGTAGALTSNDDRDMTWTKVSCSIDTFGCYKQ